MRDRRTTGHQHQWAELLTQGAHRQGLGKGAELQTDQNKFGYGYLPTPQGLAEKVLLTERFIKRKMAEHEAIKAEIAALTAKDGSLILDETAATVRMDQYQGFAGEVSCARNKKFYVICLFF